MSKDETTLKRVNISNGNLEKLEDLAQSQNVKLSDYLNRLINWAIIEEYKKRKRPNPLFLWKS